MEYRTIAAVDNKWGYARDGEIPWYFSEDFRRFKNLTMGGICIMGKSTYYDIDRRTSISSPDCLLPGRQSIVLSTKLSTIPNAHVVPDVISALDLVFQLQKESNGIVFFIGGGSIFDVGVELSNCLHLTHIDGNYNCTRFFPKAIVNENFSIISKQVSPNHNQVTYTDYTRQFPRIPHES
jgi:dihydrofolate reductase